jgi:hypothetical protein
MSTRKFDLNVEEILEDWEVHHAIREVIANAIDEKILSETKDVQIFKDSNNKWHIRDFGRGIRYEHLTQNEDEEKIRNPHVIGKFGIGLKDALATFDRKGVGVTIKSQYGNITLGRSQKHGFEDVITLHAYISPPSEPALEGTDVILDGVTAADIEKAKDLFLVFSGERRIEETKYGEVLTRRSREPARIYINGLKVAEEENFIFSYNITSLTKQIRQALNRERTNVGRSAYSYRVKSILLSCEGKEVADLLVTDLSNYATGRMHDELSWIDVQEHAVKILNAQEKVVFLTSEELMRATNMVDEARSSGYRIVTIPENLKEKIRGQADIHDGIIRDLGQFYKEYDESFEFKFVNLNKLSRAERKVLRTTSKIFRLVGGKPSEIKKIQISETMRKDPGSFVEANGLWDSANGRIIVKRSRLGNLSEYAGTLLHETAHATSGASDVSRDFETALTRLLGILASHNL